jgi:tetratricopeptide repeat protein
MNVARLLIAITVVTLSLPASAKPDATAHLVRGSKLYESGHYDEAVAELKAGYAMDPRPDFLYALGQAERKRGDCKAAIAWYQKYVDTGLTSQRTVATLMQIDRCKQELASATPAKPPAPAAPPVHAEPTPVPPPAEATPSAPQESAPQESAATPSPSPSPSPAVAAAPSRAPEHTPVYKRWWLWTTVAAVVVVGAGVGVGVWLAERPTFKSTLPDLSWNQAALGVRF